MCPQAAEEQARRAREENPRTLVSHQDHPNIKYTLDFKQKCDLTAHDDGYIQTLIKRSKFGDPLSLLKQVWVEQKGMEGPQNDDHLWIMNSIADVAQITVPQDNFG